MYDYDRRQADTGRPGNQLSWSEVHDLAVKFHGKHDRKYKQKSLLLQDTQWVFPNETYWRDFLHAIEPHHMRTKSDEETLSVVVRF